ncbi:MAG: hypothetical protein H0X37_05105 [Herpetosiphonaceae bacterium]|nr:hypothetical protein [Herpetosiphonaceae bacterium]
MILVRVVFRAKHGKVNQVVSAMKEAIPHLPHRARLLTDLSGPIDTVVIETVHDSLAAWERARVELFKSQEYTSGESVMEQAIEAAYQEYYTIEAE